MEKAINLKKNIYELCTQYPEVLDIMKELGFAEISPAMLSTMGRFMTIPKGAVMKKLDLDKIKEEFVKRGYSIID